MWIVRHGERSDVADGEWWFTADRPHDPPLTTNGHKQARAAGLAIAHERIEAIYSSPFRRCVQTACEMAAAIGGGLKVRIEPGLCEMLHHEWFDFPEPNVRDGMPVDTGMSTKELVRIFGGAKIDASYIPLFDAIERLDDSGHSDTLRPNQTLVSFPEHWHEGVGRYQQCLSRLQHAAPFSVLVTHGAGVQSCGESVAGVDMEEMDIGYCCLTNLTRQGAYGWTAASLASHKHTDGLE